MKIKNRFTSLLACLLVLTVCYGFTQNFKQNQLAITGAWQVEDGGTRHVLIFADGYMTHAAFSVDDKTFASSRGGSYQAQANEVKLKWEYDTQNSEKVGQDDSFNFTLGDNELVIIVQGREIPFTRVDDGTGALAGNWKISGRMQDGKINPIHTTGPRKTIKILSGKRFQWIAINPETKEFFGTGGGSYTFSNGKYTENIEFFSRDNSRVGKSLSFDDKLVNGEWHHSGASSTGDKIYEVWSKAK